MKHKSIIKETADTSQSSWITHASYFSLDGFSGSCIVKTSSDEEYIHLSVPINIWEIFKNSSSKGASYNRYIKKTYKCYRVN